MRTKDIFWDHFAKKTRVCRKEGLSENQEFVDDLAMTSMARLWDVGKSEPIKAGRVVHWMGFGGCEWRHSRYVASPFAWTYGAKR